MRQFTPRYDQDEQDVLLKPGQHMRAIYNHLPKWRQELIHHATSKRLAKAHKKVKDDGEQQRLAREETEMQAAAAVRQCIKSLQMAIDAINATPAPPRYQSHINMTGLVNVLIAMRNKCGVRE